MTWSRRPACGRGKRFDEFTPGTNGRASLFAILMSVIRHEYRRHGRWQNGLAEPRNSQNCAAPSTQYPEVLIGQHLLGAIDGLPAHSREVLLLAADSDLRYHEIAEALKIPIGTVTSRLSRARAQLRSQVIGSARCVPAAVTAAGKGLTPERGRQHRRAAVFPAESDPGAEAPSNLMAALLPGNMVSTPALACARRT
jgi:RNA polymerase sigma factor (sigma-70 family)